MHAVLDPVEHGVRSRTAPPAGPPAGQLTSQHSLLSGNAHKPFLEQIPRPSLSSFASPYRLSAIVHQRLREVARVDSTVLPSSNPIRNPQHHSLLPNMLLHKKPIVSSTPRRLAQLLVPPKRDGRIRRESLQELLGPTPTLVRRVGLFGRDGLAVERGADEEGEGRLFGKGGRSGREVSTEGGAREGDAEGEREELPREEGGAKEGQRGEDLKAGVGSTVNHLERLEGPSRRRAGWLQPSSHPPIDT